VVGGWEGREGGKERWKEGKEDAEGEGRWKEEEEKDEEGENEVCEKCACMAATVCETMDVNPTNNTYENKRDQSKQE